MTLGIHTTIQALPLYNLLVGISKISIIYTRGILQYRFDVSVETFSFHF